MALSGKVTSTSYSGRYYELNWTATQNVANNQSTVSWTLTAKGMGAGWIAERTVYVDIDGARQYSKTDRVERYDGTVATGSKTFTHDSAGKKSFSISIGAAVYASAVNVSGSGSFTLNQIPRAATLTSAPDFTDEANPIIKYSNPAGNSVTSLQACISFTGAKDDIPYRDISKTGNSYTFNLTDAERRTLYTRVTSGYSNTVTFFVRTIISGVTYHSTLTKTLTLVNCEPVVTGTVRNVDEYTAQMLGDDNQKMIKGFNEIEFTINATGKKGATIVSTYCANGSNRYTAGNNIINTVNNTFRFFAVDSRGNTNEYAVPVTLTMYDYQPNYCTVEAEGELVDSNKVKVKYTVTGAGFNGVINGHQHVPTLFISLGELKNDGTYSIVDSVNAGLEVDDFGENYKFTITGSMIGDDYEKSYIIIAEISDWLTTDNAQSKTIVVVPVFDWGASDFNFNVPVSIQGNLVNDYIVERGTEAMGNNAGTWYWEKWASGKAVCYGMRSFGSLACNTAWGSMYETNGYTQVFPSNLFIAAPDYFDIHTHKGSACLMTGFGYGSGSNQEISKDNTGLFFFFRPSAATVTNVHVMFYAIGRWR